MKATKLTKLPSVSRALASVLLISAAATLRTFAGDGNTASPTSGLCCDQSAAAVKCTGCNHAAAVTDLPARRTAVTLPEAAKPPKPRHTFTALGFVISGSRDGEKREWRDREAANFYQFPSSRSWAGGDANREPQGLRLFSWSW